VLKFSSRSDGIIAIKLAVLELALEQHLLLAQLAFGLLSIDEDILGMKD
jgi:hypothetical protein